MPHIARCNMNAFFRTLIIRSGHEYAVQDTDTIFKASPPESSAISASGFIDPESTTRSNVAKNSTARARTP